MTKKTLTWSTESDSQTDPISIDRDKIYNPTFSGGKMTAKQILTDGSLELYFTDVKAQVPIFTAGLPLANLALAIKSAIIADGSNTVELMLDDGSINTHLLDDLQHIILRNDSGDIYALDLTMGD